MHKKLYKAKKNWVIGLIAGSALLFGSVTGVNADANAPQGTNDTKDLSETPTLNNLTNNMVSLNNSVPNNGESTEQNGPDIKELSTSTVYRTAGVKTSMGAVSQNSNGSKNSVATNVASTNTNNDDNQGKENVSFISQHRDTSTQSSKEVSEKSVDANVYPYKATINGDENHYILSDYEYGDVTTKNVAKPDQNNDVGLHEMLFSKEIKRRGQKYTVGLVTDSGNHTFSIYVKDKNGEAIVERSGIADEDIYSGDGRYYGSSFVRDGNVKWNNDTAVAFGENTFSNGDTFDHLPAVYRLNRDVLLKTQIKVHMLGNGVLDYEVSWSRDRDKDKALAYLKSDDREQPFSFSLGKLIDKKTNSWFGHTDASPIIKINDNLYCSYLILNDGADTPHYVIQFIKVDYPTSQVTSIEDKGENPSELEYSRKIPGVAPFMPKQSASYKRGIEIYSPVSDKNVSVIDGESAVIAFDKGQTQHTIKFQRVFLTPQELSGLDSNKILNYVNSLFENTDNTSKVVNNGQDNSEDKIRKSITVQFVNNVTKKLVGKPFKVINEVKNDPFDLHDDGAVSQIKEKLPEGYSVVYGKNWLPKHQFAKNILYIYVQIKRLNPDLIGTVDVTQQDKEFLYEKGTDLGKDFTIDNAGKLIDEKSGAILVDPLNYIDLANKVREEGFGEEEAEDLFSNLTGTIANYLETIAEYLGAAENINPKQLACFKVSDALEQVGETGRDFVDTLKDGVRSLNEKANYYHKYLYNRNKKNVNERRSNFLDVRKKQMNSIFEGASTIKDAVNGYFKDKIEKFGTMGKVIISGITAIVMFAFAYLTKFIWNALQGKEMSEVFGLRIKSSKLKKK